jgi:hypothetical protein
VTILPLAKRRELMKAFLDVPSPRVRLSEQLNVETSAGNINILAFVCQQQLFFCRYSGSFVIFGTISPRKILGGTFQ